MNKHFSTGDIFVFLLTLVIIFFVLTKGNSCGGDSTPSEINQEYIDE